MHTHDLPDPSNPPDSSNLPASSTPQDLSSLSNDALLDGLHGIVASHRRVTADLIRHLGEVDARRLAVERGSPSLFSYAVERLGFSEDEACRRIEAARLARRFPAAYALLQSGVLSLTVFCLLKAHLTDDNHKELLEGVSGSSVRQAKEWLAARFPQPDVPSTIRKIPAQRSVPAASLGIAVNVPVAHEGLRGHSSPAWMAAPAAAPAGADVATREQAPAPARAAAVAPGQHGAPGRLEPLSRDRFLVKLTASRELRDKLETARDLMRHVSPDGALDVIVERALDLLLLDLQKKRQGRTERPRKALRPAKRSHVSRAARREVVERDGWRCSFVGDDGHRCDSRAFLELDHHEPKGRGGDGSTSNLRIRCRAHNRVEAERVYGAAYVARAIATPRGSRSG